MVSHTLPCPPGFDTNRCRVSQLDALTWLHLGPSCLSFSYNQLDCIWASLVAQIREGNGTPLQYSCLENPMDGGAWWAKSDHGVAKSQTRLSDFTFTFPFMHWRRKWQPTPVFLPGESQGWRSLVGCRLWGPTESDTTKATQQQQQQQWLR